MLELLGDDPGLVVEPRFREIASVLPLALYMTDAEGRVTFYNQAAADLAGRNPTLGQEFWCVSWKLYRPDGTSLPHDQCPMAVALRERRPVRGVEVIAERPDGRRVPLMPHPTPLFSAAGEFIGGLNVLVDISELKQAQQAAQDRLVRQAALHRFTDRLYRARSTEDVYAAAFEAMQAMLGCSRASILLFDRQDIMRFVADRGLSESYKKAVEGHTPWTRADVDPSPIFIPDVSRSPELSTLSGVLRAENIAALGFIPLVSGGSVIGKFMVYYDRPRLFSSDDSELALTIARQLGFAISRQAVEMELRRQNERMGTLYRISKSLTRDLDVTRIVQEVTDAATRLCGARYGAFFYNSIDSNGECYQLYALSGAPQEAFARLGMPRKTALFQPTFEGTTIVRSDDIRRDPRYGRNFPHTGMPEGHLPVVSYLAVPVVSGSGEVLGGLFLGHDRPGMFSEEAERMVAAVASQAAIAIDNGRLLQSAEREIEHRRRAEREAHESNEWLRLAMQAGKVGLWDWDIVNDRIEWTDSLFAIYGIEREQFVGTYASWLQGVHPDDRELVRNSIERSLRERVPYELEFRSFRANGDVLWLYANATVIYDGDRPTNLVGATVDITERKQSEEQRDLLVAELSHRVKNNLATVVSIARQTLPRSGAFDGVRKTFEGRIQALAQTHARLAENNWVGVSLRTMLADELAPYRREDGRNMRIEGPDVNFDPKLSVALGMAFHELATNAAKYGALSVEDGFVEVGWERQDDDLVVLWSESGGPAVEPPQRSGFGRLLLERAIAADLGGRAELDFATNGLRFRLVLPGHGRMT